MANYPKFKLSYLFISYANQFLEFPSQLLYLTFLISINYFSLSLHHYHYLSLPKLHPILLVLELHLLFLVHHLLPLLLPLPLIPKSGPSSFCRCDLNNYLFIYLLNISFYKIYNNWLYKKEKKISFEFFFFFNLSFFLERADTQKKKEI